MKVWIVQRFCEDTRSYDFDGLVFAERDSAIDFILDEWPNVDWRIQNETEESSEIWNADVWELERKTRLDVSDFIVESFDVR